jgi:hypothetical protein
MNHYNSKENISMIIFEMYNDHIHDEETYDCQKFKELCVDSNFVYISTAELKQFLALQRIIYIELNSSSFTSAKIQFDFDITTIIDWIELKTSIEMMIFHVMSTKTSFLLSLRDMNKLKLNFNNLTNELVQITLRSIQSHVIIRRWDHAFLQWDILTAFLIFKCSQSKSAFFDRRRAVSTSL